MVFIANTVSKHRFINDPYCFCKGGAFKGFFQVMRGSRGDLKKFSGPGRNVIHSAIHSTLVILSPRASIPFLRVELQHVMLKS